jgi:hypothetical protein
MGDAFMGFPTILWEQKGCGGCGEYYNYSHTDLNFQCLWGSDGLTMFYHINHETTAHLYIFCGRRAANHPN